MSKEEIVFKYPDLLMNVPRSRCPNCRIRTMEISYYIDGSIATQCNSCGDYVEYIQTHMETNHD